MQQSNYSLLIEQYKSIRLERLANEIVNRIMWIIFIAFAVFQNDLSVTTLAAIYIFVIAYYVVMEFKMLQLNEREYVVSSTMAKMNAEMEDIYIKYMHHKSFRSHSILSKIIQHEQLLWLMAFVCVSVLRFLPFA